MTAIHTSKAPERKAAPCPTCRSSSKKGHLWLGGKDYVECPDCNATGEFVMYERRISSPTVFTVTRN